jgi:long-chain acyl-CoA synthetase
MFHYFMDVARRCGAEILDGKPVSGGDRLLYALGNLLVYGPLRNVLGMSRIRVAYTAGAAIGPDLFRFYRSIGINLKQLYGRPRPAPTSACSRTARSSSTRSAAGARRRGEDRRQRRGAGARPMLLKEYYKRPDATAESIDAEGYFHDRRRRLLRRGRPPEDHRPRQGRRQARQRRHVRAQLHREQAEVLPHIKEAVAFGDGKDEVCAFINIDMGAVGNWAERRNIAYSGYTDLAQKPEVYELIRECVEQANAELAHDPPC